MASILDTFYILFKSDTDDLKKGTKKAKKITDDLQTSIEKTDKTTVQLGTAFSDIITQLSHAAIGFLSVSSILSSTQQSIFSADAIGRFSTTVGLSTETVSAWGSAVTSAGGTAQSFQGAVAGLNNQLLDLALTGNSAVLPLLNQLGIGAIDASGKIKTGFQILRDIGTRLESVPEPQAFALGQRFGFDPALIAILRSGSHEIDTLIGRQTELGVVTESQAELVRELRLRWSEITQSWRQTGLQTVERFGDGLLGLLNSVTKLAISLRSNETLITGFIIGVAGAALLAAKPILALAVPFLLLATVIGGFALAYDDLQTFIAGGDSIIGRAIERWPLLGAAIDTVAEALKNFRDAVPDWITKARTLLHWLQFFRRRSGGELSLTANSDDLQAANTLLTEAENNPLAALPRGDTGQSSPATNSRTINVTIDNVEVNTQATDASSIATDIADELRRQTENLIDNYDDGLLA